MSDCCERDRDVTINGIHGQFIPGIPECNKCTFQCMDCMEAMCIGLPGEPDGYYIIKNTGGTSGSKSSNDTRETFTSEKEGGCGCRN